VSSTRDRYAELLRKLGRTADADAMAASAREGRKEHEKVREEK
jgi:hypothetical protein